MNKAVRVEPGRPEIGTGPGVVGQLRYDEYPISFEATLWHELVGHAILILRHPNERWNNWNEGFKPVMAGDPSWGIVVDPVIAVENMARTGLDEVLRAPLYFGRDEQK